MQRSRCWITSIDTLYHSHAFTKHWLQQVVVLLLQIIFLCLYSANSSKTVSPISLGAMVVSSENSLNQVKIILDTSILLEETLILNPYFAPEWDRYGLGTIDLNSSRHT